MFPSAGRDPRAMDARGPVTGQRVPMAAGMQGPVPHNMGPNAPAPARPVRASSGVCQLCGYLHMYFALVIMFVSASDNSMNFFLQGPGISGVPPSGGGFSPGQSQVSTQDQEKVGHIICQENGISFPSVCQLRTIAVARLKYKLVKFYF